MGYVPPSRAMIQARLQNCNSTNYPATSQNSMQTQTIQNLMDPQSDHLRQHMFSRYWYTPPYSDAFETWFGLEISEARQLFCYQTGYISGRLNTSAYWQAANQGSDWSSMPDPVVQQEDAKIQNIRNQLSTCMKAH
jgi:hypothetical protein